MDEWTIENEFLKVTVSQKGAETRSVILKKNNKEYLWQGNKEFWDARSPHLFPIIGGLKGDSYSYKGVSYSMGKHGLIRDRIFYLNSCTKTSVTLETTSDAQTKISYPFDFKLQIEHRLNGAILEVRYRIQNTGSGELLCCIGGHPAIHCPLENNLQFEDYAIEFEQVESATRHLIVNDLIAGSETKTLKNKREIPLQYSDYEIDALVFEGLHSQSCLLRSPKGGASLRFHFSGFPILAFWTKPNRAPYLCFEPWFGMDDRADTSGQFEQKQPMLLLQKGQLKELGYAIEPLS